MSINQKGNQQLLLVLLAGVFLAALDIAVLGPAIPAIEKSIALSGHDISWIFSIYLLFYLIGLPLLSKLSDIQGRRLAYLISVSVFALGAVVVSIANSLPVLLAGRAIQGFGASGIFPVAAATIGDIFPPERRGRALGFLGGVYGIAFIAGPLLAGTLLRFFNWPMIFILQIPIAAWLVVGAFFMLPGKSAGEKPVMNLTGVLLLAIVLAAYAFGLNNIDPEQALECLQKPLVWPFLLLVCIFLPVLIRYERTHKNPYLTPGLFRSKQLRLTGFIAFGLGLFQSVIVFIPKLAVGLFGVSPSRASFMLLPLVLATAIVPPLSGRLLEVVGSRVIVFSGLVLALASLLLFSQLSGDTTLFYIAGAAFGSGLAIRASLKFILLNETGFKDRSAALGMLIILITVGQITGAALIGSVIASNSGLQGFGEAFSFFALLTAVFAGLSVFLKSKKHEFENEKVK